MYKWLLKTEMEHMNLNLLERFMGGFEVVKKEDTATEIDLNLGLALGGSSNRLVRSCSSSIPIVVREDGVRLGRTSSLPVETEEWRKRKEIQCFRRMEAKKRRSEKQRVVPIPIAGVKGFLSQGSVESQGGTSSGVTEFENKSLQGSSSGGEASPASIQSLQHQSNQNGVGSCEVKINKKESKLGGAEMKKRPPKENGKNSLQDMPCVFTKGDGPNGSRIDGILYKYGKGEEVRIMCVCHGKFYSPAGFVKHAGGTDVVHPLKHIVINPNSCC